MEIAHKEVIQTPRYFVDSWSTPLSAFHCEFSSTDCLLEMFARGKPTNKKIITFHANLKTSAQGESLSYLKPLFWGGMEDEKLTKFLRFCTGSYMVCVEKITSVSTTWKARTPQSSAESPCHISILSVVRGGIKQHIVLRVLGHWLCLNSHLNLPTRTASLLYISESLAVLNLAEFYTIDCNWCDYTTSELFNGCSVLLRGNCVIAISITSSTYLNLTKL